MQSSGVVECKYFQLIQNYLILDEKNFCFFFNILNNFCLSIQKDFDYTFKLELKKEIHRIY